MRAGSTENPAHGDAAPKSTGDLLSLTPEQPATPPTAVAPKGAGLYHAHILFVSFIPVCPTNISD